MAQHGEKFILPAVGLAQSLLGAFALHELPDLASDTLEQRQEGMIPLTDLAAEKLRHSEQLVAEEDRECEACVESCFTGKSCARKIVVIVNIGNPSGLCACPYTPRQVYSRRDCPPIAHRYERVHVDGWIMPDLEAAQHIRVRVRYPHSTDLPVQRFTDRLENPRRRF